MGLAFRDQLIAATLKPIGRELCCHPPGPFRDQLIAATLKLTPTVRSQSKLNPFRDQLIAATLKPFRSGGGVPRRMVIPRSADRGHIEAVQAQLATATTASIPRSADRGHIEAFRSLSSMSLAAFHSAIS